MHYSKKKWKFRNIYLLKMLSINLYTWKHVVNWFICVEKHVCYQLTYVHENILSIDLYTWENVCCRLTYIRENTFPTDLCPWKTRVLSIDLYAWKNTYVANWIKSWRKASNFLFYNGEKLSVTLSRSISTTITWKSSSITDNNPSTSEINQKNQTKASS